MQQHNFRLLFICLLGSVFSLLVGHTFGSTANVQGSNNSRRSPSPKFPDLYEATIAELQDGMVRGDFSSVDLVKVSLATLLPLVLIS
jgi:amidase